MTLAGSSAWAGQLLGELPGLVDVDDASLPIPSMWETGLRSWSGRVIDIALLAASGAVHIEVAGIADAEDDLRSSATAHMIAGGRAPTT